MTTDSPNRWRGRRWWRCCRAVCAVGGLVTCLAGCDSLRKVKVDNPVFGEPPPRRIVAADAPDRDESASDPFSPLPHDPFGGNTDIVQTNLSRGELAAPPLADNDVVARVNGKPVFAAEVLERYAPQLRQAREQAPPAELRQLQLHLLKRDLDAYIERKLLVDRLFETLKPEQVQMLEQHLDRAFEEHLETVKKKLNVQTRAELERELARQGTSLESFRSAFANQQIARQYLATKVDRDHKFGRPELLEYYRTHAEEFTIPAAVKWQQIVISRTGPEGKAAAFEKLLAAVSELKRNVPFDEVARRYSSGATAANGGHWGDWMQRGSLRDKEMERALFTLPLGQISDIFERDDAYYLVRVNERRDDGAVPFPEVQDAILERLQQQHREEQIRQALAELKQQAVIWTIFDDRPAPATADRRPAPPFQ